jgi:hypothetical protein
MRRYGAADVSTTRLARQKNLEADTLSFCPCNSLKSYKIAKAFFGNPWSKTAEFWKSLEKWFGWRLCSAAFAEAPL